MRPPPGCDPDAIVLHFPVAREFSGLRVDQFIQRRIPRLSRTRAREIVDACGYAPDGRKLRSGSRVRAGALVLLVRERLVEPPCPTDFDVIYEDRDVLAVNKPPGLPMHPTATYHRNTLTFRLRERFGNNPPAIAHRIDRETSGLVVCARTRDAERCLKGAFENRHVYKRYLAIVRGKVPDDTGLIDAPMGRATEGLHVLMETKPEGEGSEARSRYRVLERTDAFSLLEMSPETGRQHQLRVHLASIGHPIVGDKLYGPDGVAPFLEHIEHGMSQNLVEELIHERQALHAFSLELTHPGTGLPLRLEVPLAADLVSLWARLRRLDGPSTKLCVAATPP